MRLETVAENNFKGPSFDCVTAVGIVALYAILIRQH